MTEWLTLLYIWKSLSHVWLFATPWTIQSMEFSRPDTGVGSPSLLQGIFPTQGSNPALPHCKWILCQLSHKGSQNIYIYVYIYICIYYVYIIFQKGCEDVRLEAEVRAALALLSSSASCVTLEKFLTSLCLQFMDSFIRIKWVNYMSLTPCTFVSDHFVRLILTFSDSRYARPSILHDAAPARF